MKSTNISCDYCKADIVGTTRAELFVVAPPFGGESQVTDLCPECYKAVRDVFALRIRRST